MRGQGKGRGKRGERLGKPKVEEDPGYQPNKKQDAEKTQLERLERKCRCRCRRYQKLDSVLAHRLRKHNGD